MDDRSLFIAVVDDSLVHSLFAQGRAAAMFPGAIIRRYDSYSEARSDLPQCAVVICGFGLGDSKSAHDIRQATSAPMVLLTGRPLDDIEIPANARIVVKGSGPLALDLAILEAVDRSLDSP